MLDLLSKFFTEFQQQSLFAQLSFLVPLIGIPTVIGVLTSWSTKARLRKLAEGRAAEIGLLKAERDALRRASLQRTLSDAESGDAAYAATDLEGVFKQNKKELVCICENIANEKIVLWWEGRDSLYRNEALYFARVAVAISPESLIGRTILATALEEDHADKTLKLIDSLPTISASDPNVFELTVGLLSQKIDELSNKGMHSDALLFARYGVLHVKSNGDICSAEGYNVLYWLVRELIYKHHAKSIPEDDKLELAAAAKYFVDIVEATFLDADHTTHFVSKFHYATALHMVDRAIDALDVLEKENLPGRVGDCVGPKSSACFATRHLYANILYEVHRRDEAEGVIASLKTDLSAAGKFSTGHGLTYKKWAELARSRAYESGQTLRFRNAANLTY